MPEKERSILTIETSPSIGRPPTSRRHGARVAYRLGCRALTLEMSTPGARLVKISPVPFSRSRQRPWTLQLLCFIISVLFLQGKAEDALHASGWVYSQWTSRDGLPHNSVTAILKRRDGELWIGTEDGLARFDGLKFTVLDARNTLSMPSEPVQCLFEDSANRLWVGFGAYGLFRYDADQLVREPWTLPFANQGVRAMCETANGALWVATDWGLYRYLTGEVRRYDKDDGLPSSLIFSLVEDNAGRVWVGTDSGVAWIDQRGECTVVTSHEGLALSAEPTGAIWIGTRGSGLLRWSGGALQRVDRADGLPSGDVRAFTVDREGKLWAGTGGGPVRFSGSAFETIETDSESVRHFTASVHAAADGIIWLGGRNGLARLLPAKLRTLTVRHGLTNDLVRCVWEDRDGTLWIGTEGGGLCRMKDGEIVPYKRENPFDEVWALAQDGEGALWVGTPRRGVFRLHGDKIDQYPLDNYTVSALLAARDGSIWIGGGSIHRWRAGQLDKYDYAEPGFRVVFAIHEDRTGNVWLGTRLGACVLREGRFHLVPGLDAPAYCFLEQPDGSLWIGTGTKGLCHFRAGQLSFYTKANGLAEDVILQMVRDDQGSIWMTTSKGIMRISEAGLEALASGHQLVESAMFGASDGMLTSECAGKTQSTAIKTRDGRLWFATMAGLVTTQPAELLKNDVPPSVTIGPVLLDYKPVKFGSALLVPAGSHSVEIQYAALSYVAPEKVRFKYRLDGFDADWVDAGSRRVAYYTRLPAGSYAFQVIAANEDGVWNFTGTTLQLTQQPRWYQTGWFRFGAVALGAALALGLHRARVWQVRGRYAAVLAERSRIAREIHDTLIQTISAISLRLEGLKGKLASSSPAADSHLESARELARSGLIEARRSIWELRCTALESADLMQAIASVAREVSRSSDVRVQVSGDCPRLPAVVETNLFRIAQEAMLNAVRHGRASVINIDMTVDRRRVKLSVCDNGRGFCVTDRAVGAGLLGMEERAHQIGGVFSLRSTPGAGAQVSVSLPWSTSQN